MQPEIWIVLAPLVGAALCGAFGRKFGHRFVSVVAPGAVLVAFLLALWVFREMLQGERERSAIISFFTWLHAGPITARFAFLIDPLSSWMILVVSGISFLIHVYSVGYMKGDAGYYRYFAYLNLFVAFMLILVLSENVLMMFIGWEGVGLCSYLLIGFWFTDLQKAKAGMKAFIVNRIGDIGFLLAVLLLSQRDPSGGGSPMSFATLGGPALYSAPLLANVIGLLLFCGAAGKSAQIPLYVWLPDAMAGPTPVSALIHAATMVTAGVYLVVRAAPIYEVAIAASHVIAIVGLATALLAGLIAVGQNDIKKVLAYSTVSQLGLLFVAAGGHAGVAAMFHLTTHAFFKALLFLSAGSVIHALHAVENENDRQDMRKMGGLVRRLPWTFAVFLVGSLALAGVPPFSGFFSKDEILVSAWHSDRLTWVASLGVAYLTAFYIFRLTFSVFAGSFRGAAHVYEHIHESPWVMRGPLLLLALGAAASGLLGLPHWLGHTSSMIADVLSAEKVGSTAGLTPGRSFIQGFLEPGVEAHVEEGAGAMASVIGGTGVALLGILTAWFVYRRGDQVRALTERWIPGLVRWVRGRFFVDEAYDRVVVAPMLHLKDGLAAFDHEVIDGAVNEAGRWTKETAFASGQVDLRGVDGAVNLTASIFDWGGRLLRVVQSGVVQNYVFVIFIGVCLVLWLQIRL